MFMVLRFETSIIRDSFVEDVLFAIYLLGIMVIWPLFAYRLFSRAKTWEEASEGWIENVDYLVFVFSFLHSSTWNHLFCIGECVV